MIDHILKLDIAGRPLTWITREEGALLYCKSLVAYEAGTGFLRLRGGISQSSGLRSVLDGNTIGAVKGRDRLAEQHSEIPAITNARLFRRDEFTCLYCGEVYSSRELTRDHVVPVSRGGTDTWENIVTACRACNHRKADKSLAEIGELGMNLLAVTYGPNRAEGLILSNRHILADQMAFLARQVGQRRRL